MVRTVIVEDEPLSLMYLKNLLAEAFPDFEIVGTAASQEDAITLINAQKPHLVFLDIELRTGTGIQVALGLNDPFPDLIFTTALDERATSLLAMTGIPYIQKPIDSETLTRMIDKVRGKGSGAFQETALGHLRQAMQHGGIPQSLLVAGNSPRAIPLQDIISIEATENCSTIRLLSGEVTHTDQILRELDRQLEPCGFFRTHIHHLVNIRHVRNVMSDTVLMTDGNQIPLSTKKALALQHALLR